MDAVWMDKYAQKIDALPVLNEIDVQTGNVAMANRAEGWRLIDNATADVRKKAILGYGVEF